MIVYKFGGKSLSTKEKVNSVCDYISKKAVQTKIIVVVSAFGGETDKLCELYADYGGIGESREKDALLSTGETRAAALVATVLCSKGVKAMSLQASQAHIFAMGAYGKAVITEIGTACIKELLKEHDVLVVTGFQAINSSGDVVTVGRNGSDISAVAIGSALNCEVEIYSDFDGLFSGDPRNFKYKKIECINYSTLEKIANCGSGVVAKRTATIAKKSNIKLKLKGSDSKYGDGTLVSDAIHGAVCIVRIDHLSKISIIFERQPEKLNKTAEYIVKNVNFYSFLIKNDTIELIIDEKSSKELELAIAKINNLIEV
ncbi:MAG: hypothetical protein IJ542_00035 [Clostridia bacterium]|nr:hypothetical protein [Clostridia bacterium]